jgi:catechol 2,3-dioxygenase-like lactoylglutathione lyase family enzyme
VIVGLHHIQLAMPEGGEDAARGFYAGILALTEVEKPEALRARGGVWFEARGVGIHLGVERPFVAAKKAHPALQVASLQDAVTALQGQGIECRPDIDLPGIKRVYVSDPFGNRIELLEVDAAF